MVGERDISTPRYVWTILLAALSTSIGAYGQPNVFRNDDPSRLSEIAVSSDQLEPLETLYAILNDPTRSGDWYEAIRQIAAHGRSDKSTEILLEFIRREIPSDLPTHRIQGYCLGKADVFVYLAFTGGKNAQKAMREVFLDKLDSLTARWWPQFIRSLYRPDDIYVWENIFRGRAALGLLVSDSRGDQKRVRHIFQKLHDRRLNLSEAEDHLYWILVDSLVLADEGGRAEILFPTISSDVPQGPSPIRKIYMRDGHG